MVIWNITFNLDVAARLSLIFIIVVIIAIIMIIIIKVLLGRLCRGICQESWTQPQAFQAALLVGDVIK